MKKILVIGSARPNFIKIAPILAELRRYPETFTPLFIHTGQHYDANLSQSFLDNLGIGKPDVSLGIGSGSEAVRTARVMEAFESILLEEKPTAVVVVGDVTPTMACTLVCSKLWIPVVHVEAGLRSLDRRMPEEINRLVTDSIADLLLTPSPEAEEHLLREGVAPERIHFVGNVMIDTLVQCRPKIDQARVLDDLGISRQGYTLLTLHRPSNVDEEAPLVEILESLMEIGAQMPIVFSIHPRTRKMIDEFRLTDRFNAIPNLIELEPQSYFDFLKLQSSARMVLTDSGGVQEETTFLGVPCLTLRENTERPVTISMGTNELVGPHKEAILRETTRILNGKAKQGRIPDLWDGHTAERIVTLLKTEF